jgi:predicted transcriptional regulator
MFDINQLKKIRKELNLTQQQFARKARVSQSLIAKIESGKIDPTYSKVKKIELALNSISLNDEKKAKDIMTSKLISVPPNAALNDIISLLNKHAISQVLVIQNNKVSGIIYESCLLNKMQDPKFLVLKANELMVEAPPLVSEESSLSVISTLLKFYSLVLVSKKGNICGVITKADLLKSLL